MKMSVRTIILVHALCLLGFIAVGANPSDSNDENCPDGWQKIHRGCYMFVVEILSWEEGLQHCKNNQGEFTSIHSLNEKEEIQKYLHVNYQDVTKWWIGLERDSTNVENWHWLDGNSVDNNVLPWSNNLHKTRSGKVCGFALLAFDKLNVGSARCSSEEAFICEYHKIIPRNDTEPSTTPKSDEVIGASGSTILTTDTGNQDETHTTNNAKQKDIQSIVPLIETTTMHSKGDPKTSSPLAVTTDHTFETEGQKQSNVPTGKMPTKDEEVSTTQTTGSNVNSKTMTSTAGNRGVTSAEALTTTTTKKSSETTTSATAATSPSPTTRRSTTPRTSTTTTTVPTTSTTRPTTTRASTITTTTVPTTSTAQPTTTNTTRTTRIRTSTPRLTTPHTTHIPDIPRPTMVDWAKALEDFHGCYIPGTGGSISETVMNARSFYTEGRTSCPKVQIGNILWSPVVAGETARSMCNRGDGYATFQCGSERICWHGQPDITGCASKKLQRLLQKTVDVPDSNVTLPPPTIEESIQLSSQLVQATETEETTMEDVLVTSQVLTALTQVTEGGPVKDRKQVQAIVDNVVKAGSNLVSTNKSAMWEEMSQDDKVRSASTLLIAMETATVAMAQEINEPSVITQKSENIEVELRVVDMSAMENEHKKEIVYGSSHSESSFSIPMKTLKSVSRGGLAKAVFMTHYSMSDILGGRSKKHRARPEAKSRNDDSVHHMGSDNKTETRVENYPVQEEPEDDKVKEETGPRIASYILSASLGVDGPLTKLPEPISFTMRHMEEIEDKYKPLCSFWNVSQTMQQGFWSQDGCRLLHTNKSHTTCECDHLTNFAILLDVHGFEASKVHQSLLRLATIIGCVISCVSLLVSWVTFQCFTSLQGERNSIHKNLAMTLLLAEILFVFGIDQARHQILCSVIAGFLHFLFLAAFMWMFIEGLHIIFMLVQVFDASRSRLPYYYLTGYGVPLVVVGASCLFFYRGYGTDKFCWLTTERYFVWAFAGPVAIILLVNAFFLTYAMSTVCRHSEYVFNAKDKATGSGIRAWIQGALALEVLLGLTWTFGYFLINDDSLPLAYIFAVLNSLQGLFIFFFHCVLNKKAQKEYRQMARTVVRRTPSSATTHSTLTKRTQNNTNHSNSHNHSHNHDMNHSPSNSHQKLNVNNGQSMA